MDLEILQQPVWYVYFGLLELPTKEAVRFSKFQYELMHLQARLKQFTGKRKPPTTLSEQDAGERAYGEALLNVYIEEFTGSEHQEETSLHLEAARESHRLTGTNVR